jgi:hypothetical protein
MHVHCTIAAIIFTSSRIMYEECLDDFRKIFEGDTGVRLGGLETFTYGSNLDEG